MNDRNSWWLTLLAILCLSSTYSQKVDFLLNGEETSSVNINNQKIDLLSVRICMPEDANRFDRIRFSLNSLGSQKKLLGKSIFSQLQFAAIGNDTIFLDILRAEHFNPEDTVGMHAMYLSRVAEYDLDESYREMLDEVYDDVISTFEPYSTDFEGLSPSDILHNNVHALDINLTVVGLNALQSDFVWQHEGDCQGSCSKTCGGKYTKYSSYGNSEIISQQNRLRIFQKMEVTETTRQPTKKELRNEDRKRNGGKKVLAYGFLLSTWIVPILVAVGG